MNAPAEVAEDEQSWEEEAGGWSWSTGATANTAVVLRWAMWGLILLGPLLGSAAFLSRPASAGLARQQPPVAAPATGSQGAAGFAQLFVAAYISAGDGDQTKLTPFFPGATDLRLEGASGQRRGDQLTVVRLRQSDRDIWSVTVAAHVTTVTGASAGADGASPAADSSAGATTAPAAAAGSAGSVHYFQVPVATAPAGGGASGYVALAMPAEVAAPPRIQAPALVYGPWRPALPGDPLTAAVTEFLTSYLTGTGDLTRYLSPGTQLTAISPAPYTALAVDELAVEGEQSGTQLTTVPPGGTRLRVLVQLRATGPDGLRVPLTYALTLQTRAGRWEIASLDGAPAQATTPSSTSS
ncbi:conjugal transfer protein [Kitasatospora kifunensis]|uniref:conjugal transfer protein n=1 Tax=Kitasatospora kifunensis TaxID=58351 RepID=UPI0028AD2446|nr:conjugal transfer protein [Kitasatospora kifunensis]